MKFTLDLIRSRSLICEDSGCWEWPTDAKTDHARRYLCVKHDGKTTQLRRLAYRLAKGELREDHQLMLPRCGNPYCHNPDHQLAVSERVKQRRAAARGSFSKLERALKIAAAKRAQGKLSMELAREIRASAEPGPALAKRLGVNRSLIQRIRKGHAWRDYSTPFAGLLR